MAPERRVKHARNAVMRLAYPNRCIYFAARIFVLYGAGFLSFQIFLRRNYNALLDITHVVCPRL
jgi:hypothetical protein